MGKPVVHFEIGCRNSARTAEFYGKLFDWKMSPMGPATMIDTGAGIPGHITALGHEPQLRRPSGQECLALLCLRRLGERARPVGPGNPAAALSCGAGTVSPAGPARAVAAQPRSQR